MVICVGVAAFLMPLHHSPHHVTMTGLMPFVLDTTESPLRVLRASHEFTLVLIVFAFLAQVRVFFSRLPGANRLRQIVPEALLFASVDVARAAALSLYAGFDPDESKKLLRHPQLPARARRINCWSRFRCNGDSLEGAHAPLRAALSLAGLLDHEQLDAFRRDARASLAGVPDSEPTWIRPLDGMLAALALGALGEQECILRWQHIFRERFGLRHGRRVAALHRPSMIAIGTCPLWEQATVSAIAFRQGWLEENDWDCLRGKCLGVAAGGAADPASLRFIAAGKCWASLTGDSEAAAILGRRTLTSDRIATAVATLIGGQIEGQFTCSA
jgi:hypothetical protein